MPVRGYDSLACQLGENASTAALLRNTGLASGFLNGLYPEGIGLKGNNSASLNNHLIDLQHGLFDSQVGPGPNGTGNLARR